MEKFVRKNDRIAQNSMFQGDDIKNNGMNFLKKNMHGMREVHLVENITASKKLI